jgi:hypothetical protein
MATADAASSWIIRTQPSAEDASGPNRSAEFIPFTRPTFWLAKACRARLQVEE